MTRSGKTQVIEAIFRRIFDAERHMLSSALVTLDEVHAAILETGAKLSPKNTANFMKDIVRKRASANRIWPESVFQEGFTGLQETGEGLCFRFVPVAAGQKEPFPAEFEPNLAAQLVRVESASLPLASRRLGRGDESWLTQVLVRLRIVETHFSLFSTNAFREIDALQMNVKLRSAEIDAVYLARSEDERESIISCEVKGLTDDILATQLIKQALALLAGNIAKEAVIPAVAKAIGPSRIYFAEFASLTPENAKTATSLALKSEAIYELTPPVPGIGAPSVRSKSSLRTPRSKVKKPK